MHYDQLLALRRDLYVLRVQVINDYTITDEEKSEKIRQISEKIKEVNWKIKNDLYHRKTYVLASSNKEQIKAYKKQIKHEFLTQVKDGYSLEDILSFLRKNYPNPGINLDKYITRLRHPFRYFDEGYFTYEDSSKENSMLVLSSKGERYLENVANVSLKR